MMLVDALVPKQSFSYSIFEYRDREHRNKQRDKGHLEKMHSAKLGCCCLCNKELFHHLVRREFGLEETTHADTSKKMTVPNKGLAPKIVQSLLSAVGLWLLSL